ncbi:MAG: hypothetical protein CMK65_07310 [Pseudoalteromonas sp.]|uniref:hypothetical protein n=1 Tax=Pseudoalteromonas sp. TaxID=53249 RepID=UPI000C8FF609|nr:hypothetical protein [Pseudoalteromonas sp.]MAD03411.1 hypothetical protein [Pseudoalteromonas sp.]|tara:strand:+ start:16628 stop:17374 length:747 start_codon:yes stop_codon:yes gene_type:complete
MSTFVIRLPGGGRISRKKKEHGLKWLDYRSFFIKTDSYNSIIELIKDNSNSKFILISGGVGAFLYTNLCEDLYLDRDFSSTIGSDIISIMHKILIEAFERERIRIYPKQVAIKELKELEQNSDYQCFFVEPNLDSLSTDSLAVQASIEVNSVETVFLKEGAPTYHVGFDSPTVITHWKIDDISAKSEEHFKGSNGHYLLDTESCSLIKKFQIKSKIVCPSELKNLKFDAHGVKHLSEAGQKITEVIVS